MSSTPKCGQEYDDNLTSILRGAYLGNALVLGHNLGLFQTLEQNTSKDRPLDSINLAQLARYKERYVREWLCTMAAAKLISVDETGTKFWMPTGGYEALTAPGFATFLPKILADFQGISSHIEQCFKPDGPQGTAYSQYPNYHNAMSSISKELFETSLIPTLLPKLLGTYNIIKRLELGGMNCLDIGCSTGVAVNVLAKAFPKSNFFGVDLDDKAIEESRELNKSCPNTEFLLHDAGSLDQIDQWKGKFDVITIFDALHDQAYPAACLKGLPTVLRPGGVLLCADIKGTSNVFQDAKALPNFAPMLYVESLFHCMPVSLNYPNGTGFGAMWGCKRALELFKECGLHDVQMAEMEDDDFNAYYIWQKPNAAK